MARSGRYTRSQMSGGKRLASLETIETTLRQESDKAHQIRTRQACRNAQKRMTQAHTENGFCPGMQVENIETGQVFTVVQVEPRALYLKGKSGKFNPCQFKAHPVESP